jgi:hypothetical protein
LVGDVVWLEAKRLHERGELLSGDRAAFVEVDEIEELFEFFQLLR